MYFSLVCPCCTQIQLANEVEHQKCTAGHAQQPMMYQSMGQPMGQDQPMMNQPMVQG